MHEVGSRNYLRMVPPWTLGPARQLAPTRMFRLMQRAATSPASGKSGEFVFLDAPDWAHVAALTPARELVMIEQFRHGTCEVTLELPGGCVDRDERPADACARELLEETGYAGEPVEIIGTVSSNPAVMNNRTHTGLVMNATRVREQALDAGEEIAVRLVPLADIPDLVRRGVIHHSLVVAGLYYLHLRLGGR